MPDLHAVTEDMLLQDQPHRRVERIGDTVRRPVFPWTPTIHELLGHLDAVGFRFSPRVLGVDADGREILTFIGGDSGPAGWAKVVDETGLVGMARLLRDYHDAVASFRPSGGAGWAGHPGPVGDGELVCHGDFGPWNLVWRGNRPAGILDWDYAWPRPPIHDVAYALEYVAPFRSDQECLRWLAYPEPPNRRHRLELFAHAYGLTSTAGLVDEVLVQQQLVLDRGLGLAAQGMQPQLDLRHKGHFEDVAERVRWSHEHRHLFEAE